MVFIVGSKKKQQQQQSHYAQMFNYEDNQSTGSQNAEGLSSRGPPPAGSSLTVSTELPSLSVNPTEPPISTQRSDVSIVEIPSTTVLDILETSKFEEKLLAHDQGIRKEIHKLQNDVLEVTNAIPLIRKDINELKNDILEVATTLMRVIREGNERMESLIKDSIARQSIGTFTVMNEFNVEDEPVDLNGLVITEQLKSFGELKIFEESIVDDSVAKAYVSVLFSFY